MKHRWPSFQRWFAWLALLIGFLGVLVCIAAVAATWMIGSRLKRANTIVFEVLDGSLATARDRVVRVEERVEQSKITAQEIEDRFKTWAEKEARERLAVRLKVIESAETLSARLEHGEQWLDMSSESVRVARRTLELCSTIGGRMEPSSLDPILEGLTTLESKIDEATALVVQVRQATDAVSEADAQNGGIERLVRLAARVVATFGDIDQRLGELGDRLSEMRVQSGQLKIRLQRGILACEIGLTLLLIWMACGQAMLCRYGLAHSRRDPRAADSIARELN